MNIKSWNTIFFYVYGYVKSTLFYIKDDTLRFILRIYDINLQTKTLQTKPLQTKMNIYYNNKLVINEWKLYCILNLDVDYTVFIFMFT